MIDLPSSSTSTPAKTTPATTARAPDSPNNAKQNQDDDGQFHEELTREMGTQQTQAQAAKDARDSAQAAARGKTKDKGDESTEKPAAADASLAAMLNVAVVPPVLPVDAKSLPVAAEPAVADATASMSASAAAAEPIAAAIASAGSARGSFSKWLGQAASDASRTGSASMLSEMNANGLETETSASGAESGLAATLKLAESAAFGKFLPSGRDTLEIGAGPTTAAAQHHGAEAQTPAGINIGANTPGQNTHAASGTATIATHLAAPGWDRGLGEKMVWMAGQQMQVAELHLNPPELGPLQVTLTISNDQASAQFVSQHAAVREAIETAMPRLREMLAEGGIMLGNASVSADSFHDQAQAQQDSRNYAQRGIPQMDAGGSFQLSPAARAMRGLVDIFA